MPFLLLLLLYLACLVENWDRPYFVEDRAADRLWAVDATGIAMCLTVLAAGWIAWWVRRGVLLHPSERDGLLRRYGSWRFYQFLSMFLAYALSLYLLGWGWAVHEFCTIGEGDKSLLLPGAEVVLLAPLLLSMVMSWYCFYSAERALYLTSHSGGSRAYWGRWSYIAFHVRQYLAMVLLPIVMLIGVSGVRRLYPDLFQVWWFQIVAAGLLVFMIACLPWVMRMVLGLQSLPPGELRDRLLATGRRLNFRCSDILLWNTRNGVANALVVGVFPTLRYVVLSDRLLNDLTPDEVEAVFGHEAGHVKHHHMVYYLSFLFISLTVLTYAWDSLMLAQDRLPQIAAFVDSMPLLSSISRQTVQMPLFVGLLGTYIFLVFGFLSRRCERQADIYGCRAVSCNENDCEEHVPGYAVPAGKHLCPTGIRTFINALEKVAYLNGISRSKPGWLQSWQHSTIDKRVQFLQAMLLDPTLERRFQRRVGLVKWVLMIGLLTLMGFLFWHLEAVAETTAPAAQPPAQERSDRAP